MKKELKVKRFEENVKEKKLERQLFLSVPHRNWLMGAASNLKSSFGLAGMSS